MVGAPRFELGSPAPEADGLQLRSQENESASIGPRSGKSKEVAPHRLHCRFLRPRKAPLRVGVHLRGSQNDRLIVFKGTLTEILRMRQRFLREFGLAKLAIGQIQLVMNVSVMV